MQKGFYNLAYYHGHGSETIETYNELADAEKALKHVQEHGYHVAEYGDIEDDYSVTRFDKGTEFFIDQEILDDDRQIIDFISVST
jgi:hypothetical protein